MDTRTMKVALLCTSDTAGGAAVVTRRLMHALCNEGVDARMVVLHRQSDDPRVAQCGTPFRSKTAFLAERADIFLKNGLNRKDLFKVSTASTGVDVLAHPWVAEADIVVLNWINQGLLSLRGIRRLHQSGKRLVWIMHDMWCLTGICHHAHECTRYIDHCGHCPYIHRPFGSDHDLSYRVWYRKMRLYAGVPITFVAVSKWLASKCAESSLLHDDTIEVIPNAFPVGEFDWHAAPSRGRQIIVMGAARLDDPVKGLPYAIEALNLLADRLGDRASNYETVFFGDLRNPSLLDDLRLPWSHRGRLTMDEVRRLYTEASVVLSSSLYETLPGTLIEGMAAGCPAVTFDSGGQSDIVNHLSTGYLAQRLDTADLAAGLEWALNANIDRRMLHDEVARRFSASTVARKYIDLFTYILKSPY